MEFEESCPSCRPSLPQVVSVHDVSSIYRVPLLLEEQNVLKFLVKRLDLPVTTPTSVRYLHKWRNLADRCEGVRGECECEVLPGVPGSGQKV